MFNEELTYRHIQRALKRRGFKANGSHQTLIKRFKAAICDEQLFQTNNNIIPKKDAVAKFECLPNELFYQIFSYLTDSELLLSFKFLTNDGRFEELIRRRTSINLRSLRRSQFIQLTCPHRKNSSKSLITPEIIREIRLFNDDNTPGIINLFFSIYSFNLTNYFPNLQILVLDQPEQNDLIKVMEHLPALRHLSIRLSTLVRMPFVVYNNLYSSVLSSSSKSHLQSLTILDDIDEPIILPEYIHLPFLRNLTLGSLTILDVQRILQAAPQLIYFKFHLDSDQSNQQIELNLKTNITKLDINAPRAEFDMIEKLLRQMNKLKSLKLCCRGVSASVWECFIKEYLPNLIDFRFKFDVRQKDLNLNEYEQNWWIKEKKWIVVGHPLSPSFYTIPLIDSKLTLNARTAYREEKCVSSKLSNEYSNIRQVICTLNPLGFKLCRSDEVYFPQIESLTLIDYKNSQKPVSHLLNLINLSNIRHLTIDHRMRAGTFLLLVKEMPQLDSLSGQDAAFSAITNKFQNEKVNLFLKKNIKRLTISPLKACDDIRYVSQLCVVFAHINHLTLNIKWAIDIWPWLSKMLDLRSATIFCRQGSFIDLINDTINQKWFYHCTYELRSHQDLRLWIQ